MQLDTVTWLLFQRRGVPDIIALDAKHGMRPVTVPKSL